MEKKKEKAKTNAERAKLGLPPLEKTIKERYQEFKADKAGARYMVAQELLKKWPMATVGKHTRETFIYENGMFFSGENAITETIQVWLAELATKAMKSEILSILRDNETKVESRDDGAPANLINLANGVYDVNEKKLMDHDAKYRFFSKIPVKYDPTATCPEIEKFIRDIFNEEDIPFIEEWFGFCLYRSYFIKKALIIVGERNTGKSTFFRLMDAFIGRENISPVSIHDLARDKFSAASLHHKYANICDDLSSNDITSLGNFKIATGGGLAKGEYKYGEQFQFLSYAKLMFACNEIPSVEDNNDEAYFSRWVVMETSKKIPVMDPFLIPKITSPESMSGLLNIALKGLDRLLANLEFSYKKTPDDIKAQMMRSGSSIAKFAYDMLREPTDPSLYIIKSDMYNYYFAYCRENNMTAETMDKLGKTLLNFASYAAHGTGTDSRGKQDRAWRNVELVSDTPNAEESTLPPLDTIFT